MGDKDKANPNIRNIRQQTPLHGAAASGNPDMVQVLIDRGLEIDAIDELNETPFHKAIEGKKQETALALLNAGTKRFNTPDRNGERPIEAAVNSGQWQVFHTLRAMGVEL